MAFGSEEEKGKIRLASTGTPRGFGDLALSPAAILLLGRAINH